MQRADPHELASRAVQGRGTGTLLLLCDFDGTLCEFQADPAAVWLDAHRRDLLIDVASQPRTTIGLISGRRLADVRLRSGLDIAHGFAAGLHGLEIDGPGELFMHPSMADARARARTIAGSLLPIAAELPGTFVEDKDFSLAFHFREASPEDQDKAAAAFHRLVDPWVAMRQVRVMSGACVLEVLPQIDWNKGHAVTWIRERLARHDDTSPYTIYIGDDITDEDAFKVVRGDGFTIATSDRVSGADYQLAGPPEVESFLAALQAGLRA